MTRPLIFGTETEYLVYQVPPKSDLGSTRESGLWVPVPDEDERARWNSIEKFGYDADWRLLPTQDFCELAELGALPKEVSAEWFGAPPDWRLLSTDELAELLDLIEDLFAGERKDGRIYLAEGSYFYVDPPALEFATHPCKNVIDVLKAEWHGFALLVRDILPKYSQATGGTVTALRHVLTETGAGYHENYGLCHSDYFKIFREDNFYPKAIVSQILIPFLVTRPLFTGAGEFAIDEKAEAGFSSSFSQRTRTIKSIFADDARTGILHLRPPDMRQEMLRIHITCGDVLMAQTAKTLQLGVTATVLLGCAQDCFQGLNFELKDPVSAMYQLSASLSSQNIGLVELANGDRVYPTHILAAIHNALTTVEGWD